jgi:DNA-binding transcriptional MerR regulator
MLKDAGESGLTIGVVAELTGLSTHTLRYYEREGIIPTGVRRKPNGHRLYGGDVVEWLAI